MSTGNSVKFLFHLARRGEYLRHKRGDDKQELRLVVMSIGKSKWDMSTIQEVSPRDVSFVDPSDVSMGKVMFEAHQHSISFPISLVCEDPFHTPLSEQTVLMSHVSNPSGVPRRAGLCGVDLVSTYNVMEHASCISDLHHLVSEIEKMLVPGGVWIGWTLDRDIIEARFNENGIYETDMCRLVLDDRKKPAPTEALTGTYYQHSSNLAWPFRSWSPKTIEDVARSRGLVVEYIDKPLLQAIFDHEITSPNYDSEEDFFSRGPSQWLSHLIQFSSLRDVTIWTLFSFRKPLGEQIR